MEVRFYHLVKSNVYQALPVLLEKSLARNWWASVYSDDDLDGISSALWCERQNSFLAHGIGGRDENLDDCPIWLTDDINTIPSRDVVFLINPSETPKITPPLLAILFSNDDAVQHAREFWKTFKEQGMKVSYWQQRDDGKWIEKT